MTARRVVVGQDAEGRSAVVADCCSPVSITRPTGATVTEILRVLALPASVALGIATEAGTPRPLPPAGLAVRICTFPPDDSIDPAAYAEYATSLAGSYGSRTRTTDVPGMHRTDSVDAVTVLSGELCVVTETGERTLRPGDSVVLRGAQHAWRNRTDEVATAVAVMVAATR